MAEDETDSKFFQVVVKVAALLKADGDHGNDYGRGVVDDDDDNDDDNDDDKNDDNEGNDDDTDENDDSTYTSL